MKKLLVQDFLETKTFKQLEEIHGVFASFSKDGRKFSLNYGMLEAKDSDILAQQCRGLVLRMSDKRSLLSEAIEVNGRLDYSNICPGETDIYIRHEVLHLYYTKYCKQ